MGPEIHDLLWLAGAIALMPFLFAGLAQLFEWLRGR